MREKRFFWFLLFLIGALALGGCSFIEIQNLSNADVRIMVRTPDSSKSTTRLVRSEAFTSVFSSHGGRYSVQTLPDEAYRELLLEVREVLGQRLFDQAATLSGSEVAQLVQRIQELTERLENLGSEEGECAGNVPDFESVIVTIAWDTAQSGWALFCG